MNRISALEEDIKDFNDRLKFKEKRREQASNSRNYKVCDQLTEEMSAIKQLKREREAELHQLQRKQQQATWYRRKKCMATLESRSDSDQSTLCSSEPTSPMTSSLKKRKHASPFQLSSSLGSPTSPHSNPCSTPHSTPCSSPRVTTPTSPPLQRKRSSSVRPSPGPGSPTDPTSPPLQWKRSSSVLPSPGPGSPTDPTSPLLQWKRSSSVRPSPGPGSPTDPTSPPLHNGNKARRSDRLLVRELLQILGPQLHIC